jgi:hypothetical protein
MSILPIVAFLLIALGVGCVVCQNAKKDAGALKLIGYIIGVIIILTALFSLIVVAGNSISAKKQRSMMQRPMGTRPAIGDRLSPAPTQLPKAVAPAEPQTKPEVKK